MVVFWIRLLFSDSTLWTQKLRLQTPDSRLQTLTYIIKVKNKLSLGYIVWSQESRVWSLESGICRFWTFSKVSSCMSFSLWFFWTSLLYFLFLLLLPPHDQLGLKIQRSAKSDETVQKVSQFCLRQLPNMGVDWAVLPAPRDQPETTQKSSYY